MGNDEQHESLNPYHGYEALPSEVRDSPGEIVAAETVPPPASPPRIWPALLAGILTLPLAFVVSLSVLLVAMIGNLDLRQMQNQDAVENWLRGYMTTPEGILVTALPGQLTFLGVACIAAMLSPVPFRQRLRLVRGTMPLWTWPLLALSAPAVGALSSMLMSLFFDQASEQLEMLENMFRSARGWFLVMLLGLVAVLPGLSEEGLFRGYLQSRLLLRMPPALAIGISSLLFSIAHMDPLHVLAVFPLGVWLGIVAWRSNSIWPSVLGHMVNNAVSIMMTHYSEAKGFEIIADAPTIGLLGVSGVALLASIALVTKYGPSEPAVV